MNRRDLQLKVKQLAFMDQQIKRGIITESPTQSLFSIPTTRTGTTRTSTAPARGTYIIESPRRAADGTVLEEGRVVTLEAYAKACDGILEINQQGEVVYKVCFAAGTLVHTDKGPLPIEQVRVGTRVLAQPEDLYEQAALDAGKYPAKYPGPEGSQRTFRPVVNTVAHLDQHVFAVQIKPYSSSQQQATDATDQTTELNNDQANPLTTLIATPGHPFWVEGHEWLAVDQLQPGHRLHLSDGSYATVHAAGLVRRTQHAHIGFAADERVGADTDTDTGASSASTHAGTGILLDLSGGHIKQASQELALSLQTEGGALELGDAYLTTVYNFEVQEFHTYYVGDMQGAGVWVHNNNGCTVYTALQQAFDDAELQAACFPGDTYVWYEQGPGDYWVCDIQALQVGDKVLSRCEKTGEIASKRIIKFYNNGLDHTLTILCKTSSEHYSDNNGRMYISATAEHPFWVKEKGWTAASELQPGDELLTKDDDQATVVEVTKEDRFRSEVFNLEVEDFNTFFVDMAGILVHNCNPGVTISRLATNRVANPVAEWSIFHKSMAEMSDANGNVLPKYRTAAREARVDPVLGGAGINTATLPAQNEIGEAKRFYPNAIPSTNTLGRNLIPGRVRYPDRLLSSTLYPDLNGLAADIYQPTGNTDLGIVFETLKDKTNSQASVIILDLKDAGAAVSLRELLQIISGQKPYSYTNNTTNQVVQVSGPLDTIKTLLVIDANGALHRIEFPDTGNNNAVYGVATVTPTGLYTRRIAGDAAPGAQVIIRNHSQTASYQQVLETGAATQIAPITLSDIQSLLPAARQYWLTAGASPALLDAAVVEVGALVPNLAGITIGNQITLDVDGAGWGWFVDASPASHQEFVATDEDHAFEAAPTSPAHGKLDLLTVLVHELGHVLGLHHSPDGDAHDDNLMAQFLTPGVRRIPDAHELAALAALQTSGDNLFAVGATFATAVPNASNTAPTPAPWQPVPVLPRFTGGGFTDAAVGWQRSGGGNGTVTLDGQGSVVLA